METLDNILNNEVQGPDDPVVKCPPTNPTVSCCFAGVEDVTIDKGFGLKQEDMDVNLDCLARILKIKLLLHNVVAGRKVNCAVLVFDKATGKLLRLKANEITVPGTFPTCVDACVCEFCFSFGPENYCTALNLTVKVIANYADFEFPVCIC